MPERDVKWLHSGLNHDDLGGSPSKFEIAELPLNNLFDDITPEEAVAGQTDYRCFYIVNKYQDTDYDISLDSTVSFCASTINVGSVVQNEEQKITFQGPSPSPNGYFIIQLDWGPELTVYWSGSYPDMALDMQAQIQLIQYCAGVTVTVLNVFTDDAGAEFQVTFAGQLQNRKMGLITIVQNNLIQGASREYRIDNTGAEPDTWNYTGTLNLQVHMPINNIPISGIIHVPYPFADPSISITWPFMNLSYTSFSGQLFNLADVIPSIPVPFSADNPFPSLTNNDEVWIDMPNPQAVNKVNVSRLQEGSPINQTAQVIELETDMPINWTGQGSTFHVGLVKPLEGFFVWVQRIINPGGGSGCEDGFSMILNGTRL